MTTESSVVSSFRVDDNKVVGDGSAGAESGRSIVK